MTDVVLRRSTADDFEFLFHLLKSTMLEYITRTDEVWDDRVEREYLRESVVSSDYQIICRGDERIGCLSLKKSIDHTFINEIQILPGFQGRGIGTEILRGILSSADSAGTTVTLEVLKSNSRARTLYERLGFTFVDDNATHIALKWVPELSGRMFEA